MCWVDGCNNPSRNILGGGEDICKMHYHRRYRHGSVHAVMIPKVEIPSYRGAHDRVASRWGSASNYPCVHCGDTADQWAYDGTDPQELVDLTLNCRYSRDEEFYMPLCIPCHRWMDAPHRLGNMS